MNWSSGARTCCWWMIQSCRGTTSREIVQMARDAGAAKVYFASAAPPVLHPNVYGIDIPTPDELVAHRQD